jgi:hypothetical protein
MTITTEEGLMNTFRSMALALVACAGVLSVTACSAGITTASSASSPATSPGATGHSASASASAPGAAPSASTIALSEPPGSFPVPAGVKLADNVVISGTVILFFSGITPAKVLAFYTKALPQAGYKITGSEMVGEAGGTAAVMFTGHGFKGEVASVTHFTDNPGTPAGNLPGLPHKDVTSIELYTQ